MTPDLVVAETRAWLTRVVIGLNLCPFAASPHSRGRIRYVVSDATQPQDLLACLADELRHLAATPAQEIETTLLIHPRTLTDFLDYNDFLDLADAEIDRLGLEGTIQVASFHPDYRFADSPVDDIANATNRSPYPMLHLLREASVERAVAALPDAQSVFEANMATLRRLGDAGWRALRQQCRDDALAQDRTDGASAQSRQSPP